MTQTRLRDKLAAPLSVLSLPKQAHQMLRLHFSCLILTSLLITSCASPQQKAHQRETLLGNFATKVVAHLFDRNPQTYKESVAMLMREELDDQTITKLQNSGKLPEPGLEEEKTVEDAQDQKTSNRIETTSVKPIGSITEAVVPFQVTGTIVSLKDGQKKSEEPFSLEVDCKLTDAMEGYPKVVAIRGLERTGAAAATKALDARSARAKKRTRKS